MIGHKLIGSGPRGVIVFHGWLGDHTVFAPMFPYLDKNSYTYAFIDHRGYGLSRALAGEHTVDEMSSDAVELAASLGWKKYNLVGHSMGGLPLQQLIVNGGGAVESACALTPVPACGMQLPAEHKSMFEAASGSPEHKRGIIDFSTGSRLSGCWLDWMTQQCGSTVTEPAFGNYFRTFDRTDISASVKGNETPILVAVGEMDPAINPTLMQETYLSWYPNAKLEVIRNCGHYPMQEAPVYLATIMEAFFSEHGSS